MPRSGKGRGHRGSGSPSRSGPVRTCCGCGETDTRDALVRLTVIDDRLVVDLKGRLPGRGAWVHPRRDCVAAVQKNPRSVSRSLRSAPSTGGLAEALREAVVAAALDGLSMAAAAGGLVSGRDRLKPAVRDGGVAAVVVASDASDRTLDEYRSADEPRVPLVALPLDTVELGNRVGKGPRAALGVRPIGAATHLLRQLRRLDDLG